MNPLLSIVIPVYNVEAYVEKCIRSCYQQDVLPKDYEVIVVNDGTTDGSLDICTGLQQKYSSLQIISQKNKGLSAARNTGLKHAKGDYVWFVDSDDWIQKNCLSCILLHLKRNPELLWLGHSVWHHKKIVKEYIPQALVHEINGEELFTKHLNNLFYIWKFIYRREFLESNKLLFFEGLLYEDLEFTPRSLALANSCFTLPKATYNYLIRSESIANNIKVKNIEHRFFILHKLLILTTDIQLSEKFNQALIDVIYHTAEGTIGLAARAGIRIPKDGFLLISKLNQLTPSYNSIKIWFLKKFPKVYYKGYTFIYNLYKILKKIKG